MPLSCQDGDRAGWHHAIAVYAITELLGHRDNRRILPMLTGPNRLFSPAGR